jgi:thiamine biosynthesis lipoprotein
MSLRETFRAMGTDVELILDTDEMSLAAAVIAAARSEIARLEGMLSRFRPDSALSLLNRHGSLEAPPELAELVRLALALREETEGLFDPTLHDALVAAGYDRTFDELAAQGGASAPSTPPGGGDVAFDPVTGAMRLERGARLDLGGIAKGYAAERAADLLGVAGPCVVNLGGEVVVRGGPWPIGIETEDEPIVLEIAYGAVATSGCDRRRWVRDGRDRHHVIDPATGDCADTDLLRATVVAGDGARADALATALLVAGRERAASMIERLGVVAILQTPEGVIDSSQVLV